MHILTKDLVYGGVGGESAVENRELSLQSLWNVIPPSSWVDHSCQKLDVHDVRELSRFLQVKEALLLHQLPHYLIRDLQKRRQTRGMNFFL